MRGEVTGVRRREDNDMDEKRRGEVTVMKGEVTGVRRREDNDMDEERRGEVTGMRRQEDRREGEMTVGDKRALQ